MAYPRDYLMYTAIFGFFSFCWFGWAQEAPKERWRWSLGIGSAVGLILGILGGILSYLHWHDASALSDKGDFKWYLIFSISEIVLAIVGAILLLSIQKSNWVSAWVSFIVAIHFIGLAFVFDDKSLFLLAGLMLIVTSSSIPLSTHFKVAPSAILGIGNGTCLLLFSLLGLIRFWQI